MFYIHAYVLKLYANENYRKLERPKIKLIKENSKFKLLQNIFKPKTKMFNIWIFFPNKSSSTNQVIFF